MRNLFCWGSVPVIHVKLRHILLSRLIFKIFSVILIFIVLYKTNYMCEISLNVYEHVFFKNEFRQRSFAMVVFIAIYDC